MIGTEKTAKRIIAIREAVNKLETSQEAARQSAQLIENHKQDILKKADLHGELEVINRPDMKDQSAKTRLTEMARWEFWRLPLILFGSPFLDIAYRFEDAFPGIKGLDEQKELKKLHRSHKLSQIPWIIILVVIVATIVLVPVLSIIGNWQYLSFTLRIILIAGPLLLVAVGVLAAGVWQTRTVRRKMADSKNVTIHYTSQNDSYDKDQKVPNGSEYYLIITFINEHEVSIDDFTAKKTKTYGTKTMGNLLAGIFSQPINEELPGTKVTYHFLSWKLDHKYQAEVKTHFPDVEAKEPQGKFFRKTRVFTISDELCGL